MVEQAGGMVPQFKGQPWILFDTVVASDFLIGSTVNAAGQATPAINCNGEMIFFQGQGRNNANMPWYTNLDLPGQLSFGMEVWQAYLMFAFPAFTPNQNRGFDFTINPGVPPTVKLMEAIMNFGVRTCSSGRRIRPNFRARASRAAAA